MSLCPECSRPAHWPVTVRAEDGHYTKTVKVCAYHLSEAFDVDKGNGYLLPKGQAWRPTE